MVTQARPGVSELPNNLSFNTVILIFYVPAFRAVTLAATIHHTMIVFLVGLGQLESLGHTWPNILFL